MTKRIKVWPCLLLAIISLHEAHAQNMGLDWAKNIPANYSGSPSGHVWIYDFTTDDAGNAYVTGSISGTVDMDPGPGVATLAANGNSDIFILKLDAAGNFVWAKQVGNNAPLNPFSSSEMVHAIHVDVQGNVIVAGQFRDTLDMDPGPSVANLVADSGGNGFDGFILKLDSAGNYVWAVKIGGAGDDQVSQVTTDGSGNIFAAGNFKQDVDFDPGPGTAMLSSASDLFVLKLGASGTFQWAAQLFAEGICFANGIALDAGGNVYIAGRETIPSPSCSFCSQGAVSVWKLDGSGALGWFYQPDDWTILSDEAMDITCDSSGGIYVTGYFMEGIDFDPGPDIDSFTASNEPPHKEIFILKLDTGGSYIWARAIRTEISTNTPISNDPHIVLDAASNLIVSGAFTGTVDFDPGPGTATLSSSSVGPDLYDIFLLKMDTSGNYLWAKSIGGSGRDYPTGIVADSHGSLWCAGQFFSDTVDFDPGSGVTNLFPGGGFIFKLSCNDTSIFTIVDTACISYDLNGATYTASGTYTQIRPNVAGCDSIITLQLTISEPNPIITVDEFTLSTTLPYTSYQWFLNGTLISGATQATYTVTENGDYTVAVTNEHGCADTSEIYTVTNVTGIEDAPMLAGQVSVYPNPAHDQVFIQSPVAVDVAISSMDGRLIRKINDAKSFSVADLAAGIYLLRIMDKDGVLIKAEKLVKSER